MAPWRPLKRRDFFRKLRALGFDSSYSGTRHQFLVFRQHRQTIPSNSEYSIPHVLTVDTFCVAGSTPDAPRKACWEEGNSLAVLPITSCGLRPFRETIA